MMKVKEIGLAMIIALAIVMATNVASVRAITGDIVAPFGVVDINDIAACAGKFGTNDPVADVNGNGLVDIFDLLLIVINFT
jgi:hypothetical protein